MLEGESPFARWPLVLVQWMLALIYLSAAYLKLRGSGLDWANGYTLEYYLIRDGLRWNIETGPWLAQFHGLVVVLSSVTLLFEGTFFLAVLVPVLAWAYVPLGIGMHLGIHWAMSATFFGLMACYVAFIPWREGLVRLERRIARSGRPEILYDGRERGQVRWATFLSWCDWLDHLRFRDVASAPLGETVSGERGPGGLRIALPGRPTATGITAWRRVFRRLPLLWPLLALSYLPGVRRGTEASGGR